MDKQAGGLSWRCAQCQRLYGGVWNADHHAVMDYSDRYGCPHCGHLVAICADAELFGPRKRPTYRRSTGHWCGK